MAWLHVYQMLSLLLRSSGHVQNDASRGLQEGARVRSICTIDVAGCLLMVPHVLCSPAAGTTFQLLPVEREGCRVVHDTCKAVRRIMSTCSTSKAKESRAHEEAGSQRPWPPLGGRGEMSMARASLLPSLWPGCMLFCSCHVQNYVSHERHLSSAGRTYGISVCGVSLNIHLSPCSTRVVCRKVSPDAVSWQQPAEDRKDE